METEWRNIKQWGAKLGRSPHERLNHEYVGEEREKILQCRSILKRLTKWVNRRWGCLSWTDSWDFLWFWAPSLISSLRKLKKGLSKSKRRWSQYVPGPYSSMPRTHGTNGVNAWLVLNPGPQDKRTRRVDQTRLLLISKISSWTFTHEKGKKCQKSIEPLTVNCDWGTYSGIKWEVMCLKSGKTWYLRSLHPWALLFNWNESEIL